MYHVADIENKNTWYQQYIWRYRWAWACTVEIHASRSGSSGSSSEQRQRLRDAFKFYMSKGRTPRVRIMKHDERCVMLIDMAWLTLEMSRRVNCSSRHESGALKISMPQVLEFFAPLSPPDRSMPVPVMYAHVCTFVYPHRSHTHTHALPPQLALEHLSAGDIDLGWETPRPFNLNHVVWGAKPTRRSLCMCVQQPCKLCTSIDVNCTCGTSINQYTHFWLQMSMSWTESSNVVTTHLRTSTELHSRCHSWIQSPRHPLPPFQGFKDNTRTREPAVRNHLETPGWYRVADQSLRTWQTATVWKHPRRPPAEHQLRALSYPRG